MSVKYVTTKTGAGTSPVIAPHGSRMSFGVITSGTVTYTIQHTFNDVDWFDHEFVVGKTANDDGNYAFPVSGIRINVTAGSGSATLTLFAAD